MSPTKCHGAPGVPREQLKKTRAAWAWMKQTVVVGQAENIESSRRKNGDVVISHHGRVATTLRGRRADEFVAHAVTGMSTK